MTRRAILAANLIGWPLFVLDQIILRRNNRKPRHR